jgi:pimeloyl-ACP methyl ester carboxylesterase
LPAADPARRLGSLFVNPGGPGGSGVDFVQQAARLVYDPQVLARYDVVGFDPRGVGRSDPATCFRTAAQEAASTLLADGYPVTAAQEQRFLREGRALAVQCQVTSPGRFATASTANVARDLDLLRQAVGDQRLNYVGYSYGTLLGATYARLFPGRVGRWVLDGTVDPVAWTGTGTGDAAQTVPLGVRIRQGPAAAQAFQQFARRCREAGPDRCPLAALGDPATTVPALLDRLLGAPIVLPLPDGTSVTITQQLAVVTIFQSLYYPAQWRPLADALLELAALRPDASAVAAAVARTSSTLGARIRGEDYPSFGGALASICVDARQSRRPQAYPAVADRQDAVAPYFGRFRAWTGLPCEYWQITDEDAFRGPWRQATREPVVVIGTRYDPATPFSQTAPFTALFPGGRQVTVEGYGHTAAFPNVSGCATAVVTRWLADGVPPGARTTCGQDVDPFPATAAARSAAGGYLPPPPAF